MAGEGMRKYSPPPFPRPDDTEPMTSSPFSGRLEKRKLKKGSFGTPSDGVRPGAATHGDAIIAHPSRGTRGLSQCLVSWKVVRDLHIPGLNEAEFQALHLQNN